MDIIDIIFSFEQNEYTRAVRQYLLAGRTVKKRDFFVLPFMLIALLTALYYTKLDQWVLLLTLLCLAAVLLICYLFFLKPWYDYNNKHNAGVEVHLSFTEEGVFFPNNKIKTESDEEAAASNQDAQENRSIKDLWSEEDNSNVLTYLTKKRQPSFIRWDMFAEIWENREFFFLIQQPHKYFIVPKRSFTNQVELQYFLKMLYRRVGIVENIGTYDR